MAYSVKEIYFTLQGEGAWAGRPAVFCRFAGCNLWSGLERDRARAVCSFCDTDFVGTDGQGGGKFSEANALAAAVAAQWPAAQWPAALWPAAQWPAAVRGVPYVVFTGGEPLLQLDRALIDALHRLSFQVGIETNGTLAAPDGIDWICVSPKAGAPLVQTSGHELKLVYPQEGCVPEAFAELAFEQFFLQPMDGPDRDGNTQRAVSYCLAHPQWRLSLQTHKLIGLK